MSQILRDGLKVPSLRMKVQVNVILSEARKGVTKDLTNSTNEADWQDHQGDVERAARLSRVFTLTPIG